jgi:hypothetical protein
MAEREDPIERDRPVPEAEIDWSLATFEGVRRMHAQEFLALSFREKLLRIEQMSAVAARLRGEG